MDEKTRLNLMTIISDIQFNHAPAKERDDESTYRFLEGMYEGLQMAYDLIETYGKKEVREVSEA